MAYTISVDQDKKIVVVKYQGNINLAERQAAVIDGTNKVTEAGFSCVLVDLTEARLQYESLDAQDKFASQLSMHPVVSRCKVAYLSNREHSENFFIEVLARARHCNVRHCTSIEEAYNWLLEDRLENAE